MRFIYLFILFADKRIYLQANYMYSLLSNEIFLTGSRLCIQICFR